MLAAVIALTFAITACGGNDDPAPSPSPPAGGTTDTATPAPPPTDTPSGDTGDVATLQGPDLSGIQGTEIFVFHQSINPNVLGDIADFEALHNVSIRIEETPWAQYYSRLMSLIMAGDSPDIFDSNDEVLPMYALREIAMPIDGLYTPDAPWLDFDVMHGMRYMGRTYILQEIGRVPHLIFYNATMFNRYGLPTPMELYLQGDWTVDRMFDISREFMADIDQTGELNQFGFTATSVYMLFGANQLPITTYDPVLGQFQLSLNGAQQISILQDAIERINNEDIHPFGWHGDLFANGRLAMMGHEAWFANSLIAMEDDWSIAPFPTGRYGNPNYNHIRTWGASVATGANNPLGGVAFVEFQYARNLERGSDFFNQGWMNPAREAGVRAAMDKTSFFSLHNGIPNFRPIADQVTWDINAAEGRTATDIINAHLSAMQSYIDDFNNLIPGWEDPREFTDPGPLDFSDGTIGYLSMPVYGTQTIVPDGEGGYDLHIEFDEVGWHAWFGTDPEHFDIVGGNSYRVTFEFTILRVGDSSRPEGTAWFYTQVNPGAQGWTDQDGNVGERSTFVQYVAVGDDNEGSVLAICNYGALEMLIHNFNIEVQD